MVKPKTSLILILAILISIIGGKLRFHQYNTYPSHGDTYDEYKAPFSGIGLINQGIPTSWSWYPEYQDVVEKRYIGNGLFRIVKPWFDEPFLFSYMAGIVAKTNDMDTFDDVDIDVYRLIMVYTNCLNIFLLFLLVWFNSNWQIATISSLIYATVPTIVLASRLPISDNMVATFMLISLLSLKLYLKSAKLVWLIIATFVSAISLHLKSTGIFIPISLVAILWFNKKYRSSFSIIVATLISLAGWYAYGYYYNWSLFLNILKNSSGRELFSPTVIINLFTTYRIGEKIMGIDGWLLWCWASLVSFFIYKPNKKSSFLLFPLISYLIFFTIMSGHIKGWYRLPFFPLISWGGGMVIFQIIKKPKIIPFFFFSTLAIASSYVYGHGLVKWNDYQVDIFQYLFLLVMLPFMLKSLFRSVLIKRICQITVLLLFIYSLYLNYQTIFQYQDVFYYGSI